MKQTALLLFLISQLLGESLYAQMPDNPNEVAVHNSFFRFFNAMRNRDTVELKKISFHTGTDWFYTHVSSNRGPSAASFNGFIQTVGSKDGPYGKCRNEFENISINVYDQYALLTANYECNDDDNQIHNSGMYTIQFLKRMSEEGELWKVFRVFRYVKVRHKEVE